VRLFRVRVSKALALGEEREDKMRWFLLSILAFGPVGCGSDEPGKMCSQMISCCNDLQQIWSMDEYIQRCASYDWTDAPPDSAENICTFRVTNAVRAARAAGVKLPPSC